MNNTQLECFIRTADSLSFMKAAEELHMSQSSVSKQVQSLENELNAKLFDRSTRHVALTVIGERFLPEARSIVHEMDHSRSWIANFSRHSSYSIRIGYTEATELPSMSTALRNMRREYPNVHPAFRLGDMLEGLSRLELGSLDIVFGLNDVKYNHQEVVFRPIEEIRLDLVVAAGHPLFNRKSVTIGELKRFSQILYFPPHLKDVRVVEIPTEQSSYLCNSASEAYALAVAGLGYALIPDCYTNPEERTSRIPVSDSEVKKYGIYYRKGKMFPALRKFIGFYQKVLEKEKNSA